jgi:hypothetical protein
MHDPLLHTLHHARHGPPLKNPKNPFIAFVCGFLFGPFGVGIYLGNWTDFFLPLTAVILASCGTAGIAAPIAWMFCGAYGAIRASSSSGH